MSQDTRTAAVAEAIAQADASLCNAGLTTYTELRAAMNRLTEECTARHCNDQPTLRPGHSTVIAARDLLVKAYA